MLQRILVQRVLYVEKHTTQSIIELQRIRLYNGEKLQRILIVNAFYNWCLQFNSLECNARYPYESNEL